MEFGGGSGPRPLAVLSQLGFDRGGPRSLAALALATPGSHSLVATHKPNPPVWRLCCLFAKSFPLPARPLTVLLMAPIGRRKNNTRKGAAVHPLRFCLLVLGPDFPNEAGLPGLGASAASAVRMAAPLVFSSSLLSLSACVAVLALLLADRFGTALARDVPLIITSLSSIGHRFTTAFLFSYSFVIA